MSPATSSSTSESPGILELGQCQAGPPGLSPAGQLLGFVYKVLGEEMQALPGDPPPYDSELPFCSPIDSITHTHTHPPGLCAHTHLAWTVEWAAGTLSLSLQLPCVLPKGNSSHETAASHQAGAFGISVVSPCSGFPSSSNVLWWFCPVRTHPPPQLSNLMSFRLSVFCDKDIAEGPRLFEAHLWVWV